MTIALVLVGVREESLSTTPLQDFVPGRAANFGCSRLSDGFLRNNDKPAENGLQPKLAALR
jgi:hypothetical protein